MFIYLLMLQCLVHVVILLYNYHNESRTLAVNFCIVMKLSQFNEMIVEDVLIRDMVLLKIMVVFHPSTALMEAHKYICQVPHLHSYFHQVLRYSVKKGCYLHNCCTVKVFYCM